MKVSEIMSKRPAYCWLSTSARTAAAIMQDKDIGILAVTKDPFTMELAGVVTDRDLCLHVVAAGRDPSYIWISECVTSDPVCCTAEDDLRHALGCFQVYGVSHPGDNDRIDAANRPRHLVRHVEEPLVARPHDQRHGHREIAQPLPQ